jgi:hypothetical protein
MESLIPSFGGAESTYPVKEREGERERERERVIRESVMRKVKKIARNDLYLDR